MLDSGSAGDINYPGQFNKTANKTKGKKKKKCGVGLAGDRAGCRMCGAWCFLASVLRPVVRVATQKKKT